VSTQETFLDSIKRRREMSNPLTDEEKALIRQLLKDERSHNSIARELNRSQSTISDFARREGIVPVSRTPVSAIQRRREFALEERLEATGEIMAKVLEIAATAKSGREIKECSVAWGVLCDKRAIMEGLPSSRTETRSTQGPGTINLEEEFKRLDEQLEGEARQEQERLDKQRHQALEEE
jgi:hypothetical protein